MAEIILGHGAHKGAGRDVYRDDPSDGAYRTPSGRLAMFAGTRGVVVPGSKSLEHGGSKAFDGTVAAPFIVERGPGRARLVVDPAQVDSRKLQNLVQVNGIEDYDSIYKAMAVGVVEGADVMAIKPVGGVSVLKAPQAAPPAQPAVAPAAPVAVAPPAAPVAAPAGALPNWLNPQAPQPAPMPQSPPVAPSQLSIAPTPAPAAPANPQLDALMASQAQLVQLMQMFMMNQARPAPAPVAEPVAPPPPPAPVVAPPTAFKLGTAPAGAQVKVAAGQGVVSDDVEVEERAIDPGEEVPRPKKAATFDRIPVVFKTSSGITRASYHGVYEGEKCVVLEFDTADEGCTQFSPELPAEDPSMEDGGVVPQLDFELLLPKGLDGRGDEKRYNTSYFGHRHAIRGRDYITLLI